MTICPQCQTQNSSGATYCIGCGQPLPGRTARPGGGSAGGGPNKGMAMAAMILGIVSLPTLGCFLVGGITAIILGVIAIGRANKEPDVYGGKGMAIAGIIMAAFSLVVGAIGIVAAIAIPSLLRARVSSNESAVIGDVRAVISAEVAYANENGGYYDTTECLVAPSGCIPGYSGTRFLDPVLTESGQLKHGYRRQLYLGPAPEGLNARVSPTSVKSFAYVAEPMSVGQTGVRAFCGDDSGRVCYWTNGRPTEIVDGKCPTDCATLPR